MSQLITVAKLQLRTSNENNFIVVGVGSSQHEELFYRVTVLGRLRSTSLVLEELSVASFR